MVQVFIALISAYWLDRPEQLLAAMIGVIGTRLWMKREKRKNEEKIGK